MLRNITFDTNKSKNKYIIKYTMEFFNFYIYNRKINYLISIKITDIVK